MDLATFIGLIMAVGAIGGGSVQTVVRVPAYLKIAAFNRTHSFSRTIDAVIVMAEKARREGILGLESILKDIEHPFLRKGVRLVIDGTEVTVLRDILETEIAYVEERHKKGINFFQKAGGFSPTMGILGTVLALIHTLGNTSDA